MMKFTFLLYINRSGSTFLANELSKTREILVCPEAEILVNLLVKKHGEPLTAADRKALLNAVYNDRKLRYWKLDPVIVEKSGESRLDLLFALLENYRNSIKPEAGIIVFKAVDLMHYIDILLAYNHKLTVDISFLALIRDPRAIYNSQRRTYVKHRKRHMCRNPLIVLYQWEYLFSRSREYGNKPYFHPIRFEDLVASLHEQMHDILAFLGLPAGKYNPALQGDLMDRIPADQLYLHPDTEELPKNVVLEKWKEELGRTDRDFIQDHARVELAMSGYTVSGPGHRGILFYLLRFRYRMEIFLKTIYRRLLNILSIPV